MVNVLHVCTAKYVTTCVVFVTVTAWVVFISQAEACYTEISRNFFYKFSMFKFLLQVSTPNLSFWWGDHSSVGVGPCNAVLLGAAQLLLP